MRKITLFFFTLIMSLPLCSQIIFEKGYFIDNTSERTACLIKNIDWKDNPREIKYKLTENSPIMDTNIDSIQEFGILNGKKYKRFKVNIDRSSDNLQNIVTNRNPEWENETLFLEVLIEGKANLYYYEEVNLRRFFFENTSKPIQQLIFKYYLSQKGNKLTNYDFKNQLLTSVNCDNSTPENTFKRLKYNRQSLSNYFIQYNYCDNNEIVYSKKENTKSLFHFKIKSGINFSSLSIENTQSNTGLRDTDFGNNITMRFGVEAEYVFPFNKNKWAIYIEPTYQYFKADSEYDVNLTLTILTHQKAVVDYNFIEVPISLRHYIFLKKNSSLFINVAYVIYFNLNSTIEFEVGDNLEIRRTPNLALGMGYNFNNKWSTEFRYNFAKNVLGNYLFWDSTYNSPSIILGYTLF